MEDSILDTVNYNPSEFVSRSYDCDPELLLFISVDPTPRLSPDGPWVAGGAVRRLVQGEDKILSDVDYFFASQEQLSTAVSRMEASDLVTLTSKTAAVHNYLVKFRGTEVRVQFIHMAFFPTLPDVLDSFDFTICQVGLDGKDLVVGKYALWDIARKRLALHRLTYGTATIRRLIKYSRSGFTACSGVLSDILERAIDDPSVVKREVEYVD